MRILLGMLMICAALPLFGKLSSPPAVIYQSEREDDVYPEREARRLGDDVDIYYDRDASRRRTPDPRGSDYEPSIFLQEEPLHQDTMDRDDYEPSKFLQEEPLHHDTLDRDDYEPSKFLQEEPLHQDYLGD